MVQDERERLPRLGLIWIDGGFSDEPFFKTGIDRLAMVLEVVLCPQSAQSFVLLPRRWVVESPSGGG